VLANMSRRIRPRERKSSLTFAGSSVPRLIRPKDHSESLSLTDMRCCLDRYKEDSPWPLPRADELISCSHKLSAKWLRPLKKRAQQADGYIGGVDILNGP
jgi:hypothetical protein